MMNSTTTTDLTSAGTTPTDTASCAVCQATVRGDAPLDWVRETDSRAPDRGVRYYCADCARTHLRSIEAGLDVRDW